MNPYLLEGERLDELHLAGLRIIQKPGEVCFTQDTVLLADFARLPKRARVCDLGAASGALSFLLLGCEESLQIDALELQESLFKRMERNIKMNGLEERIKAYQADMADIRSYLQSGKYDLVLSNPPYFKVTDQEMKPQSRIARQQINCNYDMICHSAAYLLKTRGHFAFCCPAEGLLEAFLALSKEDFQPKRLRMVASFRGKPPYLALIDAVRGGRAGGLLVEPELIIYAALNRYTDETRKIYHLEAEK